jgi:hypothetical protein
MTLYGERKYGVQCINQGPPPKLVKLHRSLNNEVYTKVKIDKHLSSEFKINKGLRQGDAIAPLLSKI